MSAVPLVTVRPALPYRPSMPVELLDTVDATAHLDPLQLGALLGLCRAFWAGGARPLPGNDVDLMRLSGCDTRRWRLVRETVLSVFESLKEPIASVYAETMEMRQNRAKAAEAMNVARARKKPKLSLVDQTVQGLLEPAKKFDSTGAVYDVNGTAIPRRVIRSHNTAARLTDKS